MRDFFIETKRIGFSKWNIEDIEFAQLLWGNREVSKYICASGSFSAEDVMERLKKEINTQNTHDEYYEPTGLYHPSYKYKIKGSMSNEKSK